jgi:hypothetical protein
MLHPQGIAAGHHAHVRVKARNSDGKVCGEGHHRAKYADAIITLVRDWHELEGIGARLICKRLAGMQPPIRMHVQYVQDVLDYSRRPFVLIQAAKVSE